MLRRSTCQPILSRTKKSSSRHAETYRKMFGIISAGEPSLKQQCGVTDFGLDSLAFRPRILVDVSTIEPSTTFLGHKLRVPVMLAPIGSLQSITPEGGVAVAKAA